MVNYNAKDVEDYLDFVSALMRKWGLKPRGALYKKIFKLVDDVLEAISKENGFKTKAEAVGKIPLTTKLGDKSLARFNQLKEFIKAEERKHLN